MLILETYEFYRFDLFFDLMALLYLIAIIVFFGVEIYRMSGGCVKL